MLALSYGFIFKTFQAEQLTDYNRYIYSYYIGWFILALGCLSVALLPQITVKCEADGPTAVFAATRRQPQAAFELFVLVLACGMLFRQSQLILPQLSVLGFADSEFTDRRAERAEAELVCSYLAPDDRVFYVGQGDNGEGWFSAVFDFYPILVDYSGTVTTDPDTGETKMIGGGGELGLPELQPAEGVKTPTTTPLRRRSWTASCAATAARCCTSRRWTIFLCRATPICLPTSWRRRRAAKRCSTA